MVKAGRCPIKRGPPTALLSELVVPSALDCPWCEESFETLDLLHVHIQSMQDGLGVFDLWFPGRLLTGTHEG
eukprot:461361-Karenia_brevis.AAC.1